MMRASRYHGLRSALIALAVALVWSAVRRPFRVAVQGRSMSPALQPGDFLVATRSGPVGRGSLVVVQHPARPGYEMVKRLVGLPGDVVDGHAVAIGERWVVGDNPRESTDSRQFGAVDERAVQGVVRLRYWPPSRFGLV